MNNQQVSSLARPGELLKQTFQVYKNRFWVFLGISVIPFLVSLVFAPFLIVSLLFNLPFISFYESLGPFLLIPLILVIVVLAIIMVIVNLWAGVSLLYAIKEREQKIGIRESFAKSWPKILSYWWISILVGVITILGFLLLIIPGIIFSIWFSLAGYVLVSEDLKGMRALSRSKRLIKGYWFKVFWRFLTLGFVIVIIYIAFSLLITPIAVLFKIPFLQNITNILNIFITPFFVTFGFLIYENLKQLKWSRLTT